jgi:aspartyl-tRNA(Asn)/glutamyl-tRNA(Gln) amidotransferase subunit B
MELGAFFKTSPWNPDIVSSVELSAIITHLLRKQITGRTAKLLLSMKVSGDSRSVEQIITDEDMLLKPLSQQEYIEMAKSLLEEKDDVVKDIIEKGRHGKVKWFVGQMMARGKEGTVEADKAESVLRGLLGLPEGDQRQ